MVCPKRGCGQPLDGNYSDFRIFLHSCFKDGIIPGFRSRSCYHFRPLSRSSTAGSGGWYLQTDRRKDLGFGWNQRNDIICPKNVGVVSVQVERTKDAKLLADEIKVRVDSILNFPEEAEKAMVEVATQKRKVLAVAIHGKADSRSLRKLADKTLDDLTNLPGITQVEIAGIRKPEIGIEVSENALREHGMSFDDVARALKKSSVDIPGGVARTSSGETLLRSMGKARDGREFNELEVMTTANGSNLKLNDLAWVKDGFEDKVLYTEFSDEPAVTLRVFRVGKQSPLDISKKVSDYVESISPTLPEGLSMTIWKDSSFYLQGRLEMMIRNAFQGLLLVFLVLSLFLRPSLAIWVAIGLPISFMVLLQPWDWWGHPSILSPYLPLLLCLESWWTMQLWWVSLSTPWVLRERNPYRHQSWELTWWLCR